MFVDVIMTLYFQGTVVTVRLRNTKDPDFKSQINIS